MKINDKEYKLSYTGETLLIYKEEFKKDLIMEAMKMDKDGVDLVSVFEICWAMAKTNDKDIPDFREFMSSITDVTATLLNGKIIEEMTSTISKDGSATKELKKKKILNLMKG